MATVEEAGRVHAGDRRGVLTLLTACAVGPDYVRPMALAPAAYKEMNGWKVAQPRDNVIRGAWWEVFADPQLNALEAQVDVSNQNMAVAEAQFQEACAGAGGAGELLSDGHGRPGRGTRPRSSPDDWPCEPDDRP